MDPNLIHVDWERTGEALTIVILLSLIVERLLAIFFENRFFIKHVPMRGIKELIASIVSILICFEWKFDAISMILLTEQTRPIGYILTGTLIAGGSKASVKLFHDVMGIKSNAYKNRHQTRAEAKQAKAESLFNQAITSTTKSHGEDRMQKAKRLIDEIRSDMDTGQIINDPDVLKRLESSYRQAEKALKAKFQKGIDKHES